MYARAGAKEYCARFYHYTGIFYYDREKEIWRIG